MIRLQSIPFDVCTFGIGICMIGQNLVPCLMRSLYSIQAASRQELDAMELKHKNKALQVSFDLVRMLNLLSIVFVCWASI